MPRPAPLLATLALAARIAVSSGAGAECTDTQVEDGCCDPWEIAEDWAFVDVDKFTDGGRWLGAHDGVRWDFADEECGDAANTARVTTAKLVVNVAVDTEIELFFSGTAASQIEKFELFDQVEGVRTNIATLRTRGAPDGQECVIDTCHQCNVIEEPQTLTLTAGQHSIEAVVTSIDHVFHENAFFQMLVGIVSTTCDACTCGIDVAEVDDTLAPVAVGDCLLSGLCGEEGLGCDLEGTGEVTSCLELMTSIIAGLDQSGSTPLKDTCTPALRVLTGQCEQCSACAVDEERLFASGWSQAWNGSRAAAAAAFAGALSAVLAGAAVALRRSRARLASTMRLLEKSEEDTLLE